MEQKELSEWTVLTLASLYSMPAHPPTTVQVVSLYYLLFSLYSLRKKTHFGSWVESIILEGLVVLPTIVGASGSDCSYTSITGAASRQKQDLYLSKVLPSGPLLPAKPCLVTALQPAKTVPTSGESGQSFET